MIPKTYIGDGVYLEYDGEHLQLTCNDGVCDYQTIYLDSEVMARLQHYIKQIQQQAL